MGMAEPGAAPSTSWRPPAAAPVLAGTRLAGQRLERRGRWWVFGSFLLCPCHLPLTLAVLASVFAGTGLGALLSDHVWVAGTIISLAWLTGTAYGFRLLVRARDGAACTPRRR